jgi:hypothetical protein
VRSLAVLAAAAAIFVLFLVRNDRRAEHLVRSEEEAVRRLRELAAAPPGPPRVEAGYRYEWLSGGELPPLVVARPVTAGEDGILCFAATGAGRVYSFDLLAQQPAGAEPAWSRLRARLAAATGGAPALPPGWRQVE